MVTALVMRMVLAGSWHFPPVFTDSHYKCSGANDAGTLSEVEFLWPALMIASSAFQAGASILKVMTRIIVQLCGFAFVLYWEIETYNLKLHDFYVNKTGVCFHWCFKAP